MEDRVERGEKDLTERIQQFVEKKMEEKFEECLDDVLDEKITEKLKEFLPLGRGASGPPQVRGGAPLDAKEERFWKVRRSLRMWPIKGDYPRKEVQAFFLGYLGFDAPFVNSMGAIDVMKMGGAVQAKSRTKRWSPSPRRR